MKVDVGLVRCSLCGLAAYAPPVREGRNVGRDASRVRERLEVQVREHAEACGGEVAVRDCAQAHEMAGLLLVGAEPDALSQSGRGAIPVCPFRVWFVLADGEAPPEGWGEVRADLLLSHWHRGCRTLAKAVERVPDQWGGSGAVECRAGCGDVEGGLSAQSALVLGFAHAAEHALGEVTLDVVGCLSCESTDVVASPVDGGLPAAVGFPSGCACEVSATVGRTVL